LAGVSVKAISSAFSADRRTLARRRRGNSSIMPHRLVAGQGAVLNHVDVTIVWRSGPRSGRTATRSKAKIAEILKIEQTRVSVKATTHRRLGFTGRREGIVRPGDRHSETLSEVVKVKLRASTIVASCSGIGYFDIAPGTIMRCGGDPARDLDWLAMAGRAWIAGSSIIVLVIESGLSDHVRETRPPDRRNAP